MPTLTTNGTIWTLNLGAEENRFSPQWIEQITTRLDEVANRSEPIALVTTGSGKFFSNGLDLDWLTANPAAIGSYVTQVQTLLERALTLPVPTVAAINGHAFGAGALLAIAHDYRVMRSDRGYFCFPEVDIDIPFTSGMAALVQAKLTASQAINAMTTGRRFGGAEATAAGLVDAHCGLDSLAARAAGYVESLAGKSRTTLGTIKRTMYTEVVEKLRRNETLRHSA